MDSIYSGQTEFQPTEAIFLPLTRVWEAEGCDNNNVTDLPDLPGLQPYIINARPTGGTNIDFFLNSNGPIIIKLCFLKLGYILITSISKELHLKITK